MLLKRISGAIVKNVLKFFGYGYVIISGIARIEKTDFFDEFTVYQGRLNDGGFKLSVAVIGAGRWPLNDFHG